jgi:Ran GTPase-activating protein (RanGAP) involved in mRNA processing and transport
MVLSLLLINLLLLSSNKITDQGLNAIASNASKFNKLKALYLEDTQITSKGVEKVMKKFKLNFEIFT